MILYSIRRKDTGQKFNGWKWDETPYWNDKGALWRDIATVVRHLSWLCSDQKWELVVDSEAAKFGASRNRVGYKKYKPKVVKSRLKRYEVIKHSVTINGYEQISAEKFFEKKRK